MKCKKELEEDEGEIDESLLTHSMCLAHVDE